MVVFLQFSLSQGAGSVDAELFPAVTIFANEGCDIMEGLVHDNALEWHDDDDDGDYFRFG